MFCFVCLSVLYTNPLIKNDKLNFCEDKDVALAHQIAVLGLIRVPNICTRHLTSNYYLTPLTSIHFSS